MQQNLEKMSRVVTVVLLAAELGAKVEAEVFAENDLGRRARAGDWARRWA